MPFGPHPCEGPRPRQNSRPIVKLCMYELVQCENQIVLSIEVLLALLTLLEDEWNKTDALEEQTEVVEVAFMCVVLFMLALRSNEIMIIHLGGIIKYLDKSTQDPKLPHVLVTLKGRLKGDMIDR
jgi:hypothetical protein